jgi:hypothetical protein
MVLMQGGSANRYNTTRYNEPYLKSLVKYISHSHPLTLRMCEILRPAAESLVRHNRLLVDNDLSAVTKGLKQYMFGQTDGTSDCLVATSAQPAIHL